MANKTLQFYGNGYGPTGTDAAVTVTFDGNTVFTGSIPTVNTAGEPLKAPDEQQVLFTFEIPEETIGIKSMTIQVTAGDQVDVTQIKSNMRNTANLAAHFGFMSPGTGSRSNVVINGEAQSIPAPRPDGESGEWTWSIPSLGTLTCDIDVQVPILN